jgi:hypothetical protein
MFWIKRAAHARREAGKREERSPARSTGWYSDPSSKAERPRLDAELATPALARAASGIGRTPRTNAAPICGLARRNRDQQAGRRASRTKPVPDTV